MSTILIINDNQTHQNQMVGILRAVHYEVMIAGTSAAGISMTYVHQPDLVICCAGIAKREGEHIFATLLDLQETCDTRLIFLATNVYEEALLTQYSLPCCSAYQLDGSEIIRLIRAELRSY